MENNKQNFLEESGDIRIDEIMPKLFPKWKKLSFEECLSDNIGNYIKLKQNQTQSKGLYPVVDQGESLINGFIDNEKLLYQGELPVIIFGDHTRRLKYIDFKFAVGADGTKIIRPEDFFLPEFFYYYLASLNITSEGYSRHYKFLKSIYVPLPPLLEQGRIVTKLDAIFQKTKKNNERLEKIPLILKRFRKSILAAAVNGKLTEDWRKENKEILDTENLLLKIQEKRIKEYEIALKKYNSHKGKKPKTPQDINFTPVVRADENLPSSWRTTRYNDISDCLDYIRKPINKTSRLSRVGNIPYYGANGQVGWIDDFLFNEELLVIVEDETFVGREIPFSYIIRGKTWVNNHAHVLRPLGDISVEYLNICSSYYDFTPLTTGTTGRRKLTQGALLNAELPIAPLMEQKEIVNRVSKLFAFADKLESRYTKAKTMIDKLPKSILAKAFRGELAAQDPNDEPAEELLKRIQEEKEKKRFSKLSEKKVKVKDQKENIKPEKKKKAAKKKILVA